MSLCQPTIAWPTSTVTKTRPSSRVLRPARAAAAATPAAVRNACLGWAVRSSSNGPAWRQVRLGRVRVGVGVGVGPLAGAGSVSGSVPGLTGWWAAGRRPAATLSGRVAAARAACFLRARLLDNMLEVSTTRDPGWVDCRQITGSHHTTPGSVKPGLPL